jgi:site-specific recombinase XerD
MKKELELELREKLRQKMLLLPDFAVDYLYSTENSRQLRSRIEYAKDMLLFFEFLIESGKCNKDNVTSLTPSDLNGLNERDLLDFLDYLTRYTKTVQYTNGKQIEQEFTNSKVGKSRKMAALNKLFAYLAKRKLITHDVTNDVDKIKLDAKVKINNRLDSNQLNRFFETILEDVGIEKSRQLKFHQKVKFRDYIMVLIMAYTGIRISELVQMDIDELNLDKRVIVVTRKGGNEQSLPLPDRIIEDLADYLTERKQMKDIPEKEKALFLSLHRKRIDPKTVRAMLDKYQRRSGIDIKITPHAGPLVQAITIQHRICT